MRLSLEMKVLCFCVSMMVAAAEPHLLVDLKDQASLFFKLLLKNRGCAVSLFRKDASHTCWQKDQL